MKRYELRPLKESDIKWVVIVLKNLMTN
jgi:hypothetical protein